MTQPSYTSVTEVYKNTQYAQFPQEHRSGGSIPVQFIKAKQAAHNFVDPPVPELILVVNIETERIGG